MKISASSQGAFRQPFKRLTGLGPLGASCLWGGMYVVSKASFGSIPPLTLGLLRLLIGGITLCLFLWLTRRLQPATSLPELPGEQRKRLPLLGACIAGTIITQFLGTSLATAHEGALLTTITPICIVPIAWLFLGGTSLSPHRTRNADSPHWRRADHRYSGEYRHYERIQHLTTRRYIAARFSVFLGTVYGSGYATRSQFIGLAGLDVCDTPEPALFRSLRPLGVGTSSPANTLTE